MQKAVVSSCCFDFLTVTNWSLQVFGGVRETDGYQGDLLLLEEDHVPTPDLYVTAKRLLEIKNGLNCEGCWGVYHKFGCEREVRASTAKDVSRWQAVAKHAQ